MLKMHACMHAANILPIIRQIAAGCASLRKIADELNDRGITTARGGLWYASTVRNIMARDNKIEALAMLSETSFRGLHGEEENVHISPPQLKAAEIKIEAVIKEMRRQGEEMTPSPTS